MNKPLELHSMKKEPLVPAKITLTLQDKLVHKAGQILGSGRSKKERTPAIVSSVIESDFERDEYVSHAGKLSYIITFLLCF